MPLVLTINEVKLNPDHDWDDVEGVKYHYPNNYKRLVREGEAFVYYRGTHRTGGRRGQAEYFGTGRVGRVWQDPETAGSSRPNWYCSVEDYRPFARPVPAKIDGLFIEDIPKNLWRNGVRSIDRAAFDRILQLAGATEPGGAPASSDAVAGTIVRTGTGLARPGRPSSSTFRRSKEAKAIGDQAELAVVEFLRTRLKARDVTHRAAMGETPGWDVDYLDAEGVLQRVEVKGSVSSAFTSVELTANEMRAARQHRASYWLYLVANVGGDMVIEAVHDPAAKIEAGVWTAQPSLYLLKF